MRIFVLSIVKEFIHLRLDKMMRFFLHNKNTNFLKKSFFHFNYFCDLKIVKKE